MSKVELRNIRYTFTCDTGDNTKCFATVAFSPAGDPLLGNFFGVKVFIAGAEILAGNFGGHPTAMIAKTLCRWAIGGEKEFPILFTPAG